MPRPMPSRGLRDDTEVLNGAEAIRIEQSLYGPHELILRRDEPGRAPAKPGTSRDRQHEVATADEMAQTRKHLSVRLAVEAPEFHLGVMFEEVIAPEQPTESARQLGRRQGCRKSSSMRYRLTWMTLRMVLRNERLGMEIVTGDVVAVKSEHQSP